MQAKENPITFKSALNEFQRGKIIRGSIDMLRIITYHFGELFNRARREISIQPQNRRKPSNHS